MPGDVLFKEDFFQRVVDVNWETEPKVYWVAGTGCVNITNGIPTDNRGFACTSEDGKHWKGTDLYRPNGQGIGPLYGGCWLREGLQEGNHPVWMMMGGTSRTQCGSCACYTDTGTDFPVDNKTVFDERHACEGAVIDAGNQIFIQSQFNFPDWHSDTFRSPNGREWQPKNYHGSTSTAVRTAEIESGFGISPAARFVTGPDSRLVPVQRQLLVPAPMAAPGSGGDKQGDKIIFRDGLRNVAAGKVKKGKFKGQTISVEIKPYHYFPEGGDHGDATVEVKVVGDNTVEPQIVNTGVTRSIAIGYGYYVFVVGGGSGTGSATTTLAWSEDGLQWKKVTMGQHNQVNPICVGPRPKKQS